MQILQQRFDEFYFFSQLQIPLGPIAELRTQETNYEFQRFAIIPSATELQFVSTKGDMIYIQGEQLHTQISGLRAWSMAFSGHWTGRHEVISSLGQWRGLGPQVVVSVCGEVSPTHGVQ